MVFPDLAPIEVQPGSPIALALPSAGSIHTPSSSHPGCLQAQLVPAHLPFIPQPQHKGGFPWEASLAGPQCHHVPGTNQDFHTPPVTSFTHWTLNSKFHFCHPHWNFSPIRAGHCWHSAQQMIWKNKILLNCWIGLAWRLEKAMAPHSSTLAWKIPWTEEPGRLQSMGSLGVGQDWETSLSLFPFMHWRRKWQPTPVFLPGESQGRGSLVGCSLWGRTESDTTEGT